MNMDKILDIAIEKDASDVHLIVGNKPMLRIARDLVPIEEMEILTNEDMNEMYDGIHVSIFQLFHGETIQYYITENYLEENGVVTEHVTQSGTLSGMSETSAMSGKQGADDRFSILNDILLSISLHDEMTAQQLTEDYVYQDYCVRELFKVL